MVRVWVKGPRRDGEVGRFPVAEAATRVGHGPFGTVRLPGLPLQVKGLPLQKRLRVRLPGLPLQKRLLV